MAGTLEGRVALVTGAGRGIGRSVALKFASQGARLVVNDLESDLTQALVDEVRGLGGEAVACPGSVSAPDFAERFIGTAVKSYNDVHIIVNNAGYTWDSVIQKMTDEQWYAIIDVHLTAPFRILRAAQPVIRAKVKSEQEAGKIASRHVVNISSVAGLFGNAGQSNYATGKAGIVGLTQTLAKEWGRLNVTVNCVAFGLIKTRLTDAPADQGAVSNIEGRDIKLGVNPTLLAAMEQMVPFGRAGTPDEAAGAVYLFCLPEASYISGQTLMCSGGLTGI